MRTDEATSSERLTTDGTKVLLDGELIATCKDEQIAAAIANALDFAGVAFGRIPAEANAAMMAVLCR
jgi:hypothetical protein